MDRVPVSFKLEKTIYLDLVSSTFKFEQFQRRSGLKPLLPVEKDQAFEIYIGEFARGSRREEIPKLESVSVIVKPLFKSLVNLSQAKSFLTTLPGYSADGEILLIENSHGLSIVKSHFPQRGGVPYNYMIILGKHSILISESSWVDADSLHY